MLTLKTYKEFTASNGVVNEFDKKQVQAVQDILKDIKNEKDAALRRYTKKFDQVSLHSFKVTQREIEDAFNECDQVLIKDLEIAFKNITTYHKKQIQKGYEIEVGTNSYIGQIVHPIQDVGIYVPGGTAAYPSTVLMNAAPANIAGVNRIVMISPPNKDGKIPPIILVAAKIAGVTEIYKVGGAQGIGALAYGTESIKKVSKIVGPGNIYVALAKREVFGTVGIDMVAGPSEILIYADKTSNPRFVAADLLSQAEHDTLSRPILVTTSQDIIKEVEKEFEKQLLTLSRANIARESLQNYGAAILVSSEEEAIEVINDIAPEHLELLNENKYETYKYIYNAGAIFLGPYSPEPVGDYIAGPNHTLPTSGTAKFSSPLGVEDFVKKTSLIHYSKETLEVYKDSIMRIATKEELTAHANSIGVRFE